MLKTDEKLAMQCASRSAHGAVVGKLAAKCHAHTAAGSWFSHHSTTC